MNRNLALAFCMALCLFSPFSLRAQIFSEWNLPGDSYEELEGRGLLIRSTPTNARVFLDGIEMGRTTLYLDGLRPGTYHVRLVKEGYRDRRFRVHTRSGSIVNVLAELEEASGRLLLRIGRDADSPAQDKLPLNPRISVDGVLHSTNALTLPVGYRTILVQAFGWEDVSTTVYVGDDSFSELDIKMKPVRFKLKGTGVSRQRFNPDNAGSLGTTALNYEVTAPGRGTLRVLNSDGTIVFVKDLGPLESWSQSAVWDGKNNSRETLEDGRYSMIVQAVSRPWDNSDPVTESISFDVFIDSSMKIYPLSLASGKSGLLFAPLPALLPALSFQLEASLLFGSPYGAGFLKSLPFAAAFRIAPISRLELAAALNVTPMFSGGARAGFSGGAKWTFYNSGIYAAAAGFNFSWIDKIGLTPFGMASGFELYVPFKMDFGNLFSLVLSPAILWTGDKGYPWEAAPRLLFSGGAMMKMTYFIAGLSIRTDFNFSKDGWPPCVMAGGEIKFFPPPSIFVFSFSGGVWVKDGSAGGFAGAAIGFIH